MHATNDQLNSGFGGRGEILVSTANYERMPGTKSMSVQHEDQTVVTLAIASSSRLFAQRFDLLLGEKVLFAFVSIGGFR